MSPRLEPGGRLPALQFAQVLQRAGGRLPYLRGPGQQPAGLLRPARLAHLHGRHGPAQTRRSTPAPRADQRPDPDLQLLLLAGGVELRVQGRLGLLCALQFAEDHLAPHGRLPYLLRPGHRPGGQHRSHPGLPHIHGPHGHDQRLGHDPRGHRRARGQGQPADHPALCLDPAGDRRPQRRLHGLRRPHGRGLHPNRRLHRQLQR